MIKVSLSEAELKIQDGKYVSITWVSKGCPSCENFESIIDSTSNELSSWHTYKVEIPYPDTLSWFEPHVSPTTYVFKEGVRQIVAPGATTKEDFVETLTKIEQGVWKTQLETELEQLEQLEQLENK